MLKFEFTGVKENGGAFDLSFKCGDINGSMRISRHFEETLSVAIPEDYIRLISIGIADMVNFMLKESEKEILR